MKYNKKINILAKRGMTATILISCLCITTFALLSSMVSINDNIFTTGNIKINLNDGKPVISQSELLFKPGMTIKKDFFIENKSDFDVYHKLYADNTEGELADVLEVTIKDGHQVVYSGNILSFNRENVVASQNSLKPKEKKDFSIYFHYPQNEGNYTQNNSLVFNLCADAVQSKNNPNKEFN